MRVPPPSPRFYYFFVIDLIAIAYQGSRSLTALAPWWASGASPAERAGASARLHAASTLATISARRAASRAGRYRRQGPREGLAAV